PPRFVPLWAKLSAKAGLFEEEIRGSCYEAGLRQLRQGSRRGEGRGDADQLHRRTPRLEAGRPLRRLRRQDARPGSRTPRAKAEISRGVNGPTCVTIGAGR